MTPVSALRIFFTGILSWVILGSAAYLLWEWADGKDPVVTETRVAPIDPNAPARRVLVADRSPRGDQRGGWRYLAGGLGLLAISFGGLRPLLRLFHKRLPSDPYSDRSGEVSILERPDGSKLYLEMYGQPGKATLIFTHGWSLDGTAWHYAKRELAKNYRLVMWDLPGLGLSKGPDNNDYSLEKLAEDLGAILKFVGKGPVILVGHSIGGMIIQTYSKLVGAKLPQLVSGIVFIHTTYTDPVRTILGATLFRIIEKPIIVPLNYLMIGIAPLAWLSNWISYRNGSTHITTRFTSFAGNQTWGQLDYRSRLAAKAWPAVIARGNLAMLKFDAEAALPAVGVPTLIIGGIYDRVTKLSASERIDQLVPNSRLMTVPAGHMGFWERHAEATESIREFAGAIARSHETSSKTRQRDESVRSAT